MGIRHQMWRKSKQTGRQQRWVLEEAVNTYTRGKKVEKKQKAPKVKRLVSKQVKDSRRVNDGGVGKKQVPWSTPHHRRKKSGGRTLRNHRLLKREKEENIGMGGKAGRPT